MLFALPEFDDDRPPQSRRALQSASTASCPSFPRAWLPLETLLTAARSAGRGARSRSSRQSAPRGPRPGAPSSGTEGLADGVVPVRQHCPHGPCGRGVAWRGSDIRGTAPAAGTAREAGGAAREPEPRARELTVRLCASGGMNSEPVTRRLQWPCWWLVALVALNSIRL